MISTHDGHWRQEAQRGGGGYLQVGEADKGAYGMGVERGVCSSCLYTHRPTHLPNHLALVAAKV